MLDLNQRSPPCKGEKGCCRTLQAFAKPAYVSRFLFYGLPRIVGYCAPGGVRVESKPVRWRGEQHMLSPPVRLVKVLYLL